MALLPKHEHYAVQAIDIGKRRLKSGIKGYCLHHKICQQGIKQYS